MIRPGWIPVVLQFARVSGLLVLALLLGAYPPGSFALASSSHAQTAATPGIYPPKHFPSPQAIHRDVLFWKRVYTEINTSEGFIHDNRNLSVIYQTISVGKKSSRKSRSRIIKKVKKKYQKILATLASGKRTGLSSEEQRVLSLWPKDVSNKELARAQKRLRFQLGQADKFRAGLIRSGSWKPFILKTLEDMGLPREIAALPHVESSFNYRAYSKVGAAGMWQFTRSTGRRYMRVDHVLDERLDPYIATIAAARLLKNNYAVTGSWPLAITAYNHGAAGMRRAVKKVGSKDIVKVLRHYKSRSFGFASRNFYPSFLAAVEIDQNPEKYFQNIRMRPPSRYEMVKLPAYISTKTILDVLNINKTDLMAANPALRPAVWRGNKYIPKGYELRVDPAWLSQEQSSDNLLAGIDADQLYNQQIADRYHRVRKGQSLSSIAARYRIRVRDLVIANNMRNKHHIRVGQVLILPDKGQKQRKINQPQTVEIKPQPAIKPQPLPEDGIYIVKKGDNIERIARKNAISVSTLLKLNQLKDRNKIYPGQKLALRSQEDNPKQEVVQVAQLDQAITIQESVTEDQENVAQESDSEVPTESIGSDVNDHNESDGNEQLLASIETLIPTSSIMQVSTKQGPETDLAMQLLQPELFTQLDNISAPVDSIGDEVLQESQDDLLADPSDYSVSDRQTIEIQAAETLGHYAEWLQLRAWDLRRLNRMKFGKPVVVGQRLKLKFKKVTPEQFEAQRIAYHKLLQEEFFAQNQIVGIDKYRLNRGDSVWNLTHKTYKIPFWLLRQYNPDLDMDRITADKVITFPKVKQRDNLQS